MLWKFVDFIWAVAFAMCALGLLLLGGSLAAALIYAILAQGG